MSLKYEPASEPLHIQPQTLDRQLLLTKHSFMCLSVCLSVYLSVCLSFCLYVSL